MIVAAQVEISYWELFLVAVIGTSIGSFLAGFVKAGLNDFWKWWKNR